MNFIKNIAKSQHALLAQQRIIDISKFSFGETNLDRKRKLEANLAKKLREDLNPSFLQVIDTSLGAQTCSLE